jgi:hypothetical protein
MSAVHTAMLESIQQTSLHLLFIAMLALCYECIVARRDSMNRGEERKISIASLNRIDSNTSFDQQIHLKLIHIETVDGEMHTRTFPHLKIKCPGHLTLFGDTLIITHGGDGNPVTHICLRNGSTSSIDVSSWLGKADPVYFLHRFANTTAIGDGKTIRVYNNRDSMLASYGYNNDAVGFGSEMAFTSKTQKTPCIVVVTVDSVANTLRRTLVPVEWPNVYPLPSSTGITLTDCRIVSDYSSQDSEMRTALDVYGYFKKDGEASYQSASYHIPLDSGVEIGTKEYAVTVLGATGTTLAVVLQPINIDRTALEYVLIISQKLQTMKVLRFQSKVHGRAITREDLDQYYQTWPSGVAYTISTDFSTVVRLWPDPSGNGWTAAKTVVW